MTHPTLEFLPADDPRLPRRAMWHHSGRAPVKRLVAQRPKRVCGYFVSWKTGQQVLWQLRLQWDFALLLDTDNEVSRFYAQTVQVRYDLGNGEQHYTPDYEVHSFGAARRVFVAVRPDHAGHGEPDFGRLQALFAEAGEHLALVRESAVRAEPRFGNARLCHPYAREPVAGGVRTAVTEALRSSGSLPLGDLMHSLGKKEPNVRPAVLGMLCRGELRFDACQSITDANLVSLPDNGRHPA